MSSPHTDAPASLRLRAHRVLGSPWAGLGCFAVLAVLAWPGLYDAILFADTHEYLRWPAPVQPDPERYLGPRLPAYAIVLKGVGTGAALGILQTYASLAAFSHLGWTLARVPGVLVLGLLSLAPTFYGWNGAALTESMSHALLAFLLDAGLVLGERHRLAWLIAWACALLAFATTRAANVIVVPFLAVPLIAWLHDLRTFRPLRAGLHPRPRRFVAGVAIALTCFVAGWGFAEASSGWRINYYTAIWTRIGPNPEARAFLARSGLSPRVKISSEEFQEWYAVHGRSEYQKWVVRQPDSYAQAWTWLDRSDEAEVIRAGYFDRFEPSPASSRAAPVAAWVQHATAIPPWLWLALVVMAPIASYRRRGRLDALSIWLPFLALGTYVQSFATFHASGIEEMRHTMGASLMLRLSALMALVCIAKAFFTDSTVSMDETPR